MPTSPTLEASGTQTATIGTEHTLTTITTSRILQLFVDANAMTNGNSTDAADVLELRIYYIILSAGTERIAQIGTYFGAQADPIKFSIPMASDISWKATLKQTAGIGRAFPWKALSI